LAVTQNGMEERRFPVGDGLSILDRLHDFVRELTDQFLALPANRSRRGRISERDAP
jgi:hypothetical protein